MQHYNIEVIISLDISIIVLYHIHIIFKSFHDFYSAFLSFFSTILRSMGIISIFKLTLESLNYNMETKKISIMYVLEEWW